MKFFVLALFVAAVAAAPKSRDDAQETLVPDGAVLPKPVIPALVPGPAILPSPALPDLAPAPVIIPQPVLPDLAPAPVIIPQPVLPDLGPAPVIIPQPALPDEIVPEPVIVVEEPDIIVGSPALVPNGEVYNDGIVQVQVNTPQEFSMLSTIQSWFSMVLNYFSNGVQTSQQII